MLWIKIHPNSTFTFKKGKLFEDASNLMYTFQSLGREKVGEVLPLFVRRVEIYLLWLKYSRHVERSHFDKFIY